MHPNFHFLGNIERVLITKIPRAKLGKFYLVCFSVLAASSVYCFIEAGELYLRSYRQYTQQPSQALLFLVNHGLVPKSILYLNDYYMPHFGLIANSSLFLRLGLIAVCASLVFFFRNPLSIKLNLIPNLLLLNVSYLATSHAITGSFIDSPIISYLYSGQENLMPFTGVAYEIVSRNFWDFTCLLSLGIVCSSIFWLSRKNLRTAVIRTIQALCLSLIPLGIEMGVFDSSEINLHVGSALESTPLAWFSNIDLLWASSIVLGLITLLGFALDKRFKAAPNQKK
jgi:hypothetical protein